MEHSPYSQNLLLASLAATDGEAIRPHLSTLELAQETVLFAGGEPISRVYFPHSGIISLVVDLASGQTIEAAMIGRESVLGGLAALDGKVSLNRAVVQVAGAASVLDVDRLRQVAERSVGFRTVLIRHEQMILAQSQQSAACNASHALEARLSRWLLRSRDLIGSEDIPLTQDYLAQMLGVQRTSVTIVAGTLQQAGLIRYRRGHIRVLNLDGLRESACECYETVKALSERLLGPPTKP
jgi:CRP-like cAMP-binding protein